MSRIHIGDTITFNNKRFTFKFELPSGSFVELITLERLYKIYFGQIIDYQNLFWTNHRLPKFILDKS
jgi:hypothetical protein